MSHHPFPWRDVFLASLREYPVVQHACDAVGIQRSTAYRARVADPEFAHAWDDAMEAGIDKAEKEAFRRAVVGYEEPLVHKGMVTYRIKLNELDADGRVIYERDENGQPIPLTVRKYSDSLMALLLKGRRKKVYAERTEVTGAEGGPVQQATVLIATGVPGDDISDIV